MGGPDSIHWKVWGRLDSRVVWRLAKINELLTKRKKGLFVFGFSLQLCF
jgi:hypothetical protein